MATPVAEVATRRGSVDPELWRVLLHYTDSGGRPRPGFPYLDFASPSSPSQAPAWEGLAGVKGALLLASPAKREFRFQ